jgi:hypothetical protein
VFSKVAGKTILELWNWKILVLQKNPPFEKIPGAARGQSFLLHAQFARIINVKRVPTMSTKSA